MQTLMIEVTSDSGLKILQSLDEKKQIRILDEATFESPSLPGKPLSLAAFKSWITAAEQSPTVSLQEAKDRWQNKKQILQNNTR